MDKVRVAFIGAGGQANGAHYPSVAEIDTAEIVAISDLKEDRLNSTADKYHVSARYTDYHKMLEKEDIDAVYIVMPPKPLLPIVLDCIAAGKHIFIEKPPGICSDETKQMVEAAAKQGILSMVGLNRRFTPVVVAAKEAVLAKGNPSMMVAEFHKNMLKSGPPWGISVLVSDIIHVMDTMRELCGEPVDVIGHVESHYVKWQGSVNFYNVLIRFDSGASGYLTGNRTAGARYERFELHGREISCYLRAPETVEIFDANEAGKVLTGEDISGTKNHRVNYGFAAENQHFIDCVLQGKEPKTNFADALKTMELIDRIEALNTGKVFE